MLSADLVKSVRSGAELSVRAMASAAEVSPSTVHRIETGAIDPTVSTLAKVLAAAGTRLVLGVETDPTLSVCGWGAWLAEQPDLDDTSWPIRQAASLAARVASTEPTARTRMISAPPPMTGDVRWDTFAAALADWIGVSHDLQRPSWTHSSKRRLDSAWWVTSMRSMHAWEFAGTPASFRHRGIYIHRDSLTNV